MDYSPCWGPAQKKKKSLSSFKGTEQVTTDNSHSASVVTRNVGIKAHALEVSEAAGTLPHPWGECQSALVQKTCLVGTCAKVCASRLEDNFTAVLLPLSGSYRLNLSLSSHFTHWRHCVSFCRLDWCGVWYVAHTGLKLTIRTLASASWILSLQVCASMSSSIYF